MPSFLVQLPAERSTNNFYKNMHILYMFVWLCQVNIHFANTWYNILRKWSKILCSITILGGSMKKLCCLVIGIFVIFSSATICEGRCNLQEKTFEQKRELNKFGGPVYRRLYSCDGENWFNEPPVLIDLRPAPRPMYKQRYGRDSRSLPRDDRFYNQPYWEDPRYKH